MAASLAVRSASDATRWCENRIDATKIAGLNLASASINTEDLFVSVEAYSKPQRPSPRAGVRRFLNGLLSSVVDC